MNGRSEIHALRTNRAITILVKFYIFKCFRNSIEKFFLVFLFIIFYQCSSYVTVLLNINRQLVVFLSDLTALLFLGDILNIVSILLNTV